EFKHDCRAQSFTYVAAADLGHREFAESRHVERAVIRRYFHKRKLEHLTQQIVAETLECLTFELRVHHDEIGHAASDRIASLVKVNHAVRRNADLAQGITHIGTDLQ